MLVDSPVRPAIHFDSDTDAHPAGNVLSGGVFVAPVRELVRRKLPSFRLVDEVHI
jgi:hypothetical protein